MSGICSINSRIPRSISEESEDNVTLGEILIAWGFELVRHRDPDILLFLLPFFYLQLCNTRANVLNNHSTPSLFDALAARERKRKEKKEKKENDKKWRSIKLERSKHTPLFVWITSPACLRNSVRNALMAASFTFHIEYIYRYSRPFYLFKLFRFILH